MIGSHPPRPPYPLVKAVLALSEAKDWQSACLEWDLHEVYFEADGSCLCGNTPITEHCVLHNHVNDNVAVVGNVCVKRFLGLPSERLFASLRRVLKKRDGSLNEPMIEYAYDKGWLNEWEHDFYVDTFRKRSMSEKQLAKRVQINERVLACVKRENNSPWRNDID